MKFGIRRAPAPGPDEITVKDAAKMLAPIVIAQVVKVGIMWGIGRYARRLMEEQRRERENRDRAGTD